MEKATRYHNYTSKADCVFLTSRRAAGDCILHLLSGRF